MKNTTRNTCVKKSVILFHFFTNLYLEYEHGLFFKVAPRFRCDSALAWLTSGYCPSCLPLQPPYQENILDCKFYGEI